MNELNIKVGDKVISGYPHSVSIGTVVNITPKSKDIVVDFGGYKETFGCDGWSKGDGFFSTKIRLLTPEIEKEIEEYILVKKCRNKVEQCKLTGEQAKKILQILEE